MGPAADGAAPANSRDAARSAVIRRLEELGLSRKAFAERSGMSRASVTAFLTPGGTWPFPASLRKLEEALGFEPGHLAHIASGRTDVTVLDGDAVEVDGEGGRMVIHFRPGFLAGLSEDDLDEVVAEARLAAMQARRRLLNRD